MSAKEKNAAAKQTYSFLAPLTNEQPCAMILVWEDMWR